MRKNKQKKYDGAVFHKIHATGDILHNTTFGPANFTVNWCGDIFTSANAYVNLQAINEYTTLANLYTEYKVFGVKIKIFPLCQSNTGGLFNCASGSDTNSIPTIATSDS